MGFVHCVLTATVCYFVCRGVCVCVGGVFEEEGGVEIWCSQLCVWGVVCVKRVWACMRAPMCMIGFVHNDNVSMQSIVLIIYDAKKKEKEKEK